MIRLLLIFTLFFSAESSSSQLRHAVRPKHFGKNNKLVTKEAEIVSPSLEEGAIDVSLDRPLLLDGNGHLSDEGIVDTIPSLAQLSEAEADNQENIENTHAENKSNDDENQTNKNKTPPAISVSPETLPLEEGDIIQAIPDELPPSNSGSKKSKPYEDRGRSSNMKSNLNQPSDDFNPNGRDYVVFSIEVKKKMRMIILGLLLLLMACLAFLLPASSSVPNSERFVNTGLQNFDPKQR
mmetsp:Transcript_8738/g.13467  ORF Transcript_8738/g.13467 Transcript_8738/m.13467 type:complete len:238 (-) Transcript_8738:407-1120(-)|eukprot:CAMPEP_0178918066 /NCGR_PEP_ID=MMETSP0786-20121207/13615_1 /TAXON_ID=186022 /ORGANISM="Thalassionema frauenfeldii, Strain CCMP 1798" /LENGTH=237 /DNA_ID=CAMNT_0020591725 /DNA_START=15 /DNA_END=731 /DNA_ORIENTATION=-